MGKKLIALVVVVVVFAILAAAGYMASSALETEEITFSTENPGGSGRGSGGFSEQTITVAHISDLHYPQNRIDSKEIFSVIKNSKADYSVLTGDIIDGDADKNDIENMIPFFKRLNSICPSFLVIGNHEIGNKYLDNFVSVAKSYGTTVLLNEVASVRKNGFNLAFIGLKDAASISEKISGYGEIPKADCKILLAHRPEKFDSYVSAGTDVRPDIVFAGHAHGGLIRIGGSALYAPDQGLFPKYTSGKYTNGKTAMIVSRGLGVSGIDYRFFNKYHIPIVRITITK